MRSSRLLDTGSEIPSIALEAVFRSVSDGQFQEMPNSDRVTSVAVFLTVAEMAFEAVVLAIPCRLSACAGVLDYLSRTGERRVSAHQSLALQPFVRN